MANNKLEIDYRLLSRRHPSRGLALIVVVYVVATLSLFAYTLALRGNLAIDGMKLCRQHLFQNHIAISVSRQACRVLALDDPNVDSYQESWAQWRRFSRIEGSQALHDENIDDWQIFWRLTDESSKININVATVDALQELDLLDSAQISSIVDWMDTDDVPNPDGAEKEYYLGLDDGYMCKDGPFDSLDELLLVKGILPKHYFGNRVNTIRLDEIEEGAIPELNEQSGPMVGIGLYDLFSVYGDGKCNLNTVSSAVLEMIPLLSDSAIQQILDQQKSGQVFKSAEDIVQNEHFSDMDKVVLTQLGKFNSAFFQLHLRITNLQGVNSEFTAVIERTPENIHVVSWNRQCRPLLRDPISFHEAFGGAIVEGIY